MIGCINFIRLEVAAGRDPRPALTSVRQGSPVPWADERYLQPVLPDDPLLCHDWQDEAQPSGSADAAGCALVGRGRQEAGYVWFSARHTVPSCVPAMQGPLQRPQSAAVCRA